MIGDRLIFTERQVKISDNLIEKLYNRWKIKNKKRVICIGGTSGTGKTEIARLLQEKFWEKYKLRSKVISLDDYYMLSWHNRNSLRKKRGINTVGFLEIQWDKIKQIIKTFRRNAKKNYAQRIHKYMDTLEYVIFNNRHCDILIIEGLYANYLMDKDVGVYLEGTVNQTYEFRKTRMKENPDNPFRQEVLEKEAKDVRKTKKQSDFIVNWEGNIK